MARSVIPLLSAWEKYTTEHPDGDVTGFAKWVLANDPASAHSENHSQSQNQPPIQPAPKTTTPLDDTARGALLIARNHRILRLFSKPIIKDLGFTKDMEFSAVVHVAIMDHPNKKELCRELLIENSTGVEITRRLAGKGFIAERPDPDDRRSALLSITDKGRKILEQGYHRLSPVHTSFLDALDKKEKALLVSLLDRINKFHSDRINSHPEILD
ncbi:MAG TPA: MarR family winged helix-turn-helix transcriptional regulator [Puia sp.]|uniref:MarR family winged helix-turn-helix transcriptional regulator n=1 Tax=Puia sp. TaxID=2045100 RepID=UPI002B737161|nr:MarR family winged helix-turn-helix transcriptional regulator [Puia sp.]HVU95128.1 MarR family winged helix-turn-helix transcriptional regulator [Puia sp.]